MNRPVPMAPRGAARIALPALIVAAAALLVAGCGDSRATPPAASPTNTPVKNGASSTSAGAPGGAATSSPAGEIRIAVDDTPANKAAKEVLAAMSRVYLAARSYADAGVLTLRWKQGEEQLAQEIPFSVAFERPNKLRLHAYEGTIVCDGTKLYGTYESLAGYVVAREAPPELTPQDVYADPFLLMHLTQREAGGPPQVAMLMARDFVELMVRDLGRPTLIDPAPIDNTTCDRVQFEITGGPLTYWIEQASRVLRRIEYPVPAEIIQQLEAQGPVSDVTLVAELVGARLDIRGDPKAFQFEIPQGAKLVQQFVDPLPVPLGKPVAEFEFLALDGQAITPKSLSGKIVVLDFWATWCQPCVKNLPLLQQVYAKYKDNPKVQFVAVSVDKPEVTDQAVREACERIQVSVPIARDTRQQLGQILQTWQVPIPMMLILGADGTLEHQEAGINPNRVAELSDHLDALLAGQSVYQRTLAAFERAMQEPPPPPGVAISEAPLSEAQASPASAPKSLQLTKLWTAPDLQQPGNIYVLPDPAGDRILVVDGWQSIVELSAEGQVLARHTLDLPETSQAAGFLRTAVDGSGKRYYVAGAVGQPQAHLFDSAWKRLLTYPAEPNNSGLFDARLVDLDQNGQPEWAISYIGDLGAEAVTLSGQRLWASRALKDVFCLVPCDNLPAGGRALLFCHSQGSIGSINAQGERGPEIIFDQQFLRLVAAADLDNNGQAEYLGIGLGETGDDILLGLTLDGSVQWTYPMPAGKQHPVLEPIAAGLPRGGRKHWVVAGVDGSIHVLAADGKPVDRFNHGAIVHGLATLERSGQGVLLISSKNGLEAFAVK